jgi:hypothetical protein
MDLIQFRIHPGVGMARIGPSTDWYFLGPEIPRFLQELYPKLRHRPNPLRHPAGNAGAATPDEGRYRDKSNNIMPQATRFRVFAYFYNRGEGDPYKVLELTSADADIEWRVTLANVKSVKADEKTLDRNEPGEKQLSTKGSSPFTDCKTGTLPNLAYLMLETDSGGAPTGRLHVVGNEGKADGGALDMPNPNLYQDGWQDTAADGPVLATVELKSAFTSRFSGFKYLAYGTKDPVSLPANNKIEAVPAWVVVNVPDYVPDMGHFVSVWDLALSQAWKYVMDKHAKAVDGQHHLAVDPTEVHSYAFYDYFTHIHPLLGLFSDVAYVSGQVRAGSIDDKGFMEGVGVRGQLAFAADAGDPSIKVSVARAVRLKAASLGQPFLILLSNNDKNPLGATHEFVLCSSVGNDGTLTVARGQEGTSPSPWSDTTNFFAVTKAGFLETTLTADVGVADRKITVDVQSAYKMPVPTPAGQTPRDGPFKIALRSGSTIEWMECSANGKVTGELTVTRGVDGTTAIAWLKSDSNHHVVAAASGHKKLDARANANLFAKGPRGPIHQTLFNRLRKPATLYERNTFTQFPGATPTVYPRGFGRRAIFDSVRTDDDGKMVRDHLFADEVNIDPGGSLARYHVVFSGMKGNACKKTGDPLHLDSGKTIPPILADEQNPPDAKIWGADAVDHAARLDDYYWIVTESDMPMLKDYALTHIQYAQFEYWAKGKVDTGHNPRWAPLFEVVFKGSSLESFFKEDGHTTEEYLNKLLKNLPRYAPAFLDVASMGKMLGGSFLPGIEVGREAGVPWNWSLYRGGTQYFPDIRFYPQGMATGHRPGMLTKDLAIPWFADYIDCAENYWPTSRPQIVYQKNRMAYSWLVGETHAADDAAFRIYWTKLGFIRRQTSDEFFEEESLFDRP